MVYNTENRMKPCFRNYQINYKFQEKRSGYYCWKLRKRKVKHQKIFINYSSRLARALSTIRTGRTRGVGEMFMRKLTKDYTYLEILVPYFNNPSEETIYGSNKIKEKHETMKLQNEEVMLRNT